MVRAGHTQGANRLYPAIFRQLDWAAQDQLAFHRRRAWNDWKKELRLGRMVHSTLWPNRLPELDFQNAVGWLQDAIRAY